jgi:hypothetical protein
MDDHHISKHIIFFTGKILPKIETIKLKIEGFQSPKGRKKKEKITEKKLFLVFSNVAINIEAQLKICTLYLVYNQIWLNLW